MITILSLNARGLRSREKMHCILTTVKCDIFCIQETNWDNTLVNQVKKLWKGPVYCAHGTASACGVVILCRESAFEKIVCVHQESAGRMVVVDLERNGEKYRIINVYAPNVEKERKIFFKKIPRWCNNQCLVIGDLNVVLSKRDLSTQNVYKEDASRQIIYNVITDNNLVDIWRILNPNKRCYSRQQIVQGKLKQTRIDLCLVSSALASQIKHAEYSSSRWSDHSFLEVRVGVPGESRNGGLWCFNCSLLEEDKFRNKIRKLLKAMTEELPFAEDVIEWWEEAKLRIKKACINYSKQKRWLEKREELETKKQISIELEKMEENPDYDISRYVILKNKSDEIEIKRCRGAMIRSRAKNIMEGEKCTAYFLGLEKKKQCKVAIKELINEKNETVTELSEILGTVQSYYKKLFTREGITEENMELTTSSIQNKISGEDKDWCDSQLTEKEIEAAMNNLNKNKSPGTDGLSGEFYEAFKDSLAPILFRIYNNMQSRNCTPETLTLGLITIIYKNRGDRSLLENYRPISLLNTDYKILAKVLANRLKSVIASIINWSQAYSIPGRDITDTILSVKETINHMTKQGGIYLGVDLEKAFDRVEHQFLWAVLSKFGFGNNFINWIKLLYNNAYSCVKCNGFITDKIQIQRSVRQGCPLSSLLYSLVAEPLALLINQDRQIKGIISPAGAESKILQYADDTNITIKDENSIDRVLTHIAEYSKASGAKININKTEIMYCGEMVRLPGRWHFREAGESVKVLGVHLGKDQGAARDKSWRELLDKIKNKLNLWKMRGLTLRGKVVVVNSLVLSKITHILSVYDMPSQYLTEINSSISAFLWGSKRNLIAHKTIISDHRNGGLKLIDIMTKKQALRIKIIQKYLQISNKHPWRDYFHKSVSSIGHCEKHNLCQIHPKKQYDHLCPFYREVFEAWGLARPLLQVKTDNRAQLLQLPILHNPEVKHMGSSLSCSSLTQAGIHRFKDILNKQGQIDKDTLLTTLRRKITGFKKKQIINTCEKIEAGLPPEWRQAFLKTGGKVQDDALTFLLSTGPNTKNIQETTTKFWYNSFLRQITKRPTSEVHWQKAFPNKNIPSIWHNIYPTLSNPKCVNTDYKIRHRRIFTGVILHQINKNVYGRDCTVCKEKEEDIEHLFLKCPACIRFTEQVKNLLMDCCSLKIPDGNDGKWILLFGLTEKVRGKNNKLINILLATARHTIYTARNYKLYENKDIDRWTFFANSLKHYIRTIYTVKPAHFKRTFQDNAHLMIITAEDDLVFNF